MVGDANHARAGGGHFGFQLKCVRQRCALPTRGVDYEDARSDAMASFINVLVNPADGRIIYDLRLISNPQPENPVKGRLDIALLCRMNDTDPEAVQQAARSLRTVLAAHFPEYWFVPIPNDDMSRYLAPFKVHTAVQVRRRIGKADLESTDRTAPRRSIGFEPCNVPESQSDPTAAPNHVFHIYAFTPPQSECDVILETLLHLHDPVLLSVRLQPTKIAHEEARFLEDQMRACDEFGYAGPFQERVRLLKKLTETRLEALRDNAARTVIEVASSGPLADAVLDTLASFFTEPAGWIDREAIGPLSYLEGGYQIHRIIPEELEAFRHCNANIELPSCGREPLLDQSGLNRLAELYTSWECANLLVLPPSPVEPYPGIETQGWMCLPPPSNLPGSGATLGKCSDWRLDARVRIRPEDRKRHVYVVGQTGSGKSSVIRTMALEDMYNGEGLCLIDPHGDLFKALLHCVPEHRLKDVVIVDPTDKDYPVGLNLLDCQPDERHRLAREMKSVMRRLMRDEYEQMGVEYAGPAFYQHMQMNLLLAMSDPEKPGTLLEFHQIYKSKEYWKRWIPLRWEDPMLKNWVEDVLPSANYTSRPRQGEITLGEYLSSKFEGFVFDPMLRNIFGQSRSTINLREIMDEGKILMVNLAKGDLTEANANFLGMVLMAKLMSAAMGRINIHEQERKGFHIYVDEFQNLATDSFTLLLSEARKFGVSLVLANQFISQITDKRLVSALLGNVGTLVCFRLGAEDAQLLAPKFEPAISMTSFLNLPNWRAYLSLLIDNEPSPPFTIETLTPDVLAREYPASEQTMIKVRDLSRDKYGRELKVVKQEVDRSFRHERD